ncbi:hypothetical protein JCM3774_001793 [Rhodotorula dairenensis]
MSTRPLDSAAALDPDRHFTLQDAVTTYALAAQPTHLGSQVRHALDVIERALDQYSLKQLALSFNGGKDCTVLVHLLAAAVLVRSSKASKPVAINGSASSPGDDPSVATASAWPVPPPILAVYVRCVSPFPQVEAFVALCARWYHLELDAVEGGMKEALQTYLDRRRHPSTAACKRRCSGLRQTTSGSTETSSPACHADGDRDLEGEQIKAIMVGTRRTDPHGATLTPFVPTDPSWPDFMRVHPILDWSYKDVWDFLRSPDLTLGAGPAGTSGLGADGRRRKTTLEWCELYDYGYTSLGSTHNTFPNPLLRSTASGTLVGGVEDSTPLGGWRPAWELEDEDAERAGRDTDLARVLRKTAMLPLPGDAASRTVANGGAAVSLTRHSIDEPDLPIGSNPSSRAASPEPRV